MDWLRAHWLWLVGPRTWMMATSLPPTSCAARLEPVVDPWWSWLSNKPVVGWVNEREARFKRPAFFWRNDFRSEMHVRFLPEGPGSRLICSCGVGRDARIVTAAWALFLIIMPLAALGWAVATDDPYERRDMAGAMPLAAVVFLYLATLLGRLMSRGDDTFLLDFVAGRLEARPVGEGA